jgi:hypothetical protein
MRGFHWGSSTRASWCPRGWAPGLRARRKRVVRRTGRGDRPPESRGCDKHGQRACDRTRAGHRRGYIAVADGPTDPRAWPDQSTRDRHGRRARKHGQTSQLRIATADGPETRPDQPTQDRHGRRARNTARPANSGSPRPTGPKHGQTSQLRIATADGPETRPDQPTQDRHGRRARNTARPANSGSPRPTGPKTWPGQFTRCHRVPCPRARRRRRAHARPWRWQRRNHQGRRCRWCRRRPW